MTRARDIALAALALVGAFAVGRLTLDQPEPTKSERIIEREPKHTVVHHDRSGTNISLEDVRAVVREELAQQTPPQKPAETREPVEGALERAKSALDTGMADGRWTSEDRARLLASLASLTRDEGEQVLGTLIPALNSGRIVVDIDHGGPI